MKYLRSLLFKHICGIYMYIYWFSSRSVVDAPIIDVSLMLRLEEFDDDSLGVIHKGRPQKMTHFLYPPSPCPQVSASDQPPSPHCGRPHLASYTVLWSDSVIAGAVKIRCSLISSSGHFTPTLCGLICGSCN